MYLSNKSSDFIEVFMNIILVKEPILFIMADKDEIVPYEHMI